MKVLFLTQWFDPEPAFKGLGFAKSLRDAGHEVQVLTGFPNYPGGSVYPNYRVRLFQRETVEGIEILRVPLYPSHDLSALRRILNYASFAASAALIGTLRVRTPDIIYVYHPPATVALPALVIRMMRGGKVVYDVQDLWPDTLRATGMVRSPLLHGLVSCWCRFVYRHVDHLIVLSNGFRERLIERGVMAERISVVFNWAGEEVEGEVQEVAQRLRSMAGLAEDATVLLYAGNLGRAQDLKALLPAMNHPRVRDEGLRLVLLGDGVERAAIEAEAKRLGLDNVVLMSPVSRAVARQLIKQADALLVHLRPDPLFEVTIPSKVQSYLFAGVPIIAGLSGEAKNVLRESRSALFFEPGDSGSLAQSIESFLALGSKERATMARSATSFYFRRLSFGRALRQTCAAMEKLILI